MFQSTRPRGRDNVAYETDAGSIQFQSTRPRGRDAASQAWHPLGWVSIHAPAWARRPGSLGAVTAAMFQSTRPRGRDDWICAGKKVLVAFQSTRPRGRDAVQAGAPALPERFNPRARVGATPYL